jgi:hypothetical protein
MALPALLTCSSQRHILVNQNVVADLGGLPDHHSHAVIDEETLADPSARMNVDSCHEPAELIYHPGSQPQVPLVQPMGKTVQKNCVKSGVTEHNLEAALRGRILVQDRIDLFPDRLKHSSAAIIS